MKYIIAATDFSPSATHAVRYAAELATTVDASLVLFNAYGIPIDYSNGVLITPIEEIKAGSEQALDRLQEEMLAFTENKILVSTVSRLGNVTDELKDYCKGKRPLAIVVGTKGKSHIEEVIFGSSALSIAKHLEWPVICVPPGADYGKGIHEVALACDFKDVAISVPAYAIRDFINLFKPVLHIVNVSRTERQSQQMAPEDGFAMHQLFYDNKPEYHYIQHADLDEGLSAFVQDKQIDMLITIPKHHNFFGRMFHRSTTKDLIDKVPIPLVCIHGGLV